MSTRRFALRRTLCSALATGSSITTRNKLICALAIFVTSFAVKSMQAVDLAPVMYTQDQPAAGMAAEYDLQANRMLQGHGILLPDQQDRSDTTLLEHPPGYSIFLSFIYRLFGRNYFRVQFIQNLLNSLSPVILFLIAGTLLGWRVGMASGIFAAVWHHLSYHSNLLLPDSLCALPILLAIYFVVRAERSRTPSYLHYALAGIMIGVSVWLRANAMMMGLFLAAVLIALSFRSMAWGRRRAVMVLGAVLVIAPITIRNYLIYRQFVPVQVGMGLNLLTSIGQSSGGERFDAPRYDHLVAMQEGARDDPRYSSSWYTPDGIQRDHSRMKKSLAIILNHPVWYSGAVVRRMGAMFKYSAEASLVLRPSDKALIEAGNKDREAMAAKVAAGLPLSPQEHPEISSGACLAPGQAVSWLRPVARGLQRTEKETALVFMFIGAVAVLLLSRRRSLLLMMVPAYYLLLQSMLHTEFRYTIPMHYFLFVLAAVGWVLAVVFVMQATVYLYNKRPVWRRQRSEQAESISSTGTP